MSYPITAQDIYRKTNDGLDIFKDLFQIKNINQNFKIRQESHPSASLYKKDGQVWKVKDHGDANGFYINPKSAIDAYMHEKALGFFEAITELAKEYGIVSKDVSSFRNFEVKNYHEFGGSLNDEGYEVVTRDFTDAELDVLGPLVTRELCAKENFYAVESYSWLIALKSGEDPNTPLEQRRVGTKKSTEYYPIFAVIERGQEVEREIDGKIEKVRGKDFIKIMQPKDPDQRFRFFGYKPPDTIFGLTQLKNSKPTKEVTEVDEETGEERSVGSEKAKHPRVFICCGERDYINVKSLGAAAIRFNSETANISDVQILTIYKEAEEILYIPDMDSTGRDAAAKLALEFMDISIVWLPKELSFRKSWKGNPLKDFTDWIKSNYDASDKDNKRLMTAFNVLVDNAMKARFWTEQKKYDRNGDFTGQVNYFINHINAFHFLKLNGVHKVVDPSNGDDVYYVQQNKHIVKKISTDEIKGMFLNFVKNKRQKHGVRFYPDGLLNMLYTTEAISDKKLTGLEPKEFDFTDCGVDYQYFFFRDYVWKISKAGVEIVKSNDIFCKEENLIDVNIISRRTQHRDLGNIRIENDYFRIWKDKEGNWDIEIKEKNCEFFNYLINSSRVFWKEELRDVRPEDVKKYQQENRFLIEGGRDADGNLKLTADQIYEQKLHLINKIDALGYLLHSYKDDSVSKMVWGVDNEVVEENKSYGRSGKSLYFHKALFIFKESLYIGSRNARIMENEFLFNNVNENTRYILFDDADKNFPVKRLFTYITGDLNVNRKNKDPFVISFFKSPKFAYTSNFAPTDLDPSLVDRTLFVAWGDWYHGLTERFPEYKPRDDFGHNFFSDWDNEQWIKFINLMAQSLAFFLGTPEVIGAPESNIKKRNLIAEMGILFMEWATDYFTDDRLNCDVVKNDAFADFKMKKSIKDNYSSQLFKKKIEQFCELNGYIFNPREMINEAQNRRILRKINGESKEVIHIRTKKQEAAGDIENEEIYPGY